MADIQHIRLKYIRPPKSHLRLVDKESFQYMTLVDSIDEYGVLTSIVVRPATGRTNKKYELTEGLHRFTASLELKLVSIPATIIEATDDELLDLQLQLNLLRPEAKPSEIARRLRRILSRNPNLTIGGLSLKTRMSQFSIRRHLCLSNLHEKVQTAVDRGQVPIESGVMLSKLRQDDQLRYLDKAKTTFTREFKPLIASVVKNQRERRQVAKFIQRWEGPFTPVPYSRSVRELARQIKNPAEITQMMERDHPETHLESALHALIWAIHLDPKSAAEQRDNARRRGQTMAP